MSSAAFGIAGLVIAAMGVWLGYVIGRARGYRDGCAETRRAMFGRQAEVWRKP